MENTFLKIGNHLSNEFFIISDKGCRTEKQYQALLGIINSSDFLFASSNPLEFDANNNDYNCTFRFQYFDNGGYMNVVRITPTGIIKENWKSETPILQGDEIILVKKIIRKLKLENNKSKLI